MLSPFVNDIAARAVLETLRWPQGALCPRCCSGGGDVFLIGGKKHSHRDGVFHCKQCRRQFSVTVGTSLERLRVPLSAWLRAAREFSYKAPKHMPEDTKPTLLEMQSEIGVSYRTVLRMRDIIKHVASQYRGHKNVFGSWPRSFMLHLRENHEKTVGASGVLADALPARTYPQGVLSRTERLLRLLLATPKPPRRKRRASLAGSVRSPNVSR